MRYMDIWNYREMEKYNSWCNKSKQDLKNLEVVQLLFLHNFSYFWVGDCIVCIYYVTLTSATKTEETKKINKMCCIKNKYS